MKRRNILLLPCLVVGLLFLTIIPATAHAEVTSTSPVANQSYEKSPEKLKISFNETIEITPSAIRLYDSEGQRVTLESTKKISSNSIAANLPPLDKGTYVAAYNVVSADSHPVNGAIIFAVKSKIDTSISENNTIENILDGNKVSGLTKTVGFAARLVIFVSLGLLVAITFYNFLFSNQDFISKTRGYLSYSSLALVVSVLISIAAQISEVYGVDLFDIFDGNFIAEQISSKFVIASLIKIALVIGIVISSFFLKTRKLLLIPLFLGLLLSFTPAFTGHSSAGDMAPFAIIFSFVHVYSMSLWFGGLILLICASKKISDLTIFSKFSKIALYCVVALGVTGLFAWIRQVRSLDATLYTSFGNFVLVKVGLFIAVVFIAYYSRKKLKQLIESNADQKSLLKLMCYEVAILIVVLGVTAALVNTIPAKTALALPVAKQVKTEQGFLELGIDPAKSGSVQIHVYALDANGVPKQLDHNLQDEDIIKVTLMNKEKNVGPININMRFQGLNHFQSLGASIPFSGEWTVTARLTTGEFDQQSASAEFNIR